MGDVVQERTHHTPYTVLFFSPYNTCHILIYDVICLFVGPIMYYLCPCKNISSMGRDLCVVHGCITQAVWPCLAQGMCCVMWLSELTGRSSNTGLWAPWGGLAGVPHLWKCQSCSHKGSHRRSWRQHHHFSPQTQVSFVPGYWGQP